MPIAIDPKRAFNKTLLPQSFYARDALLVAKNLLGKIICHNEVSLRITETEAYRWPGDSANHSFKGKTQRNLAMWGPAGHAYVYLCYGIHHMLNFVTNQEGEAAAVLIRSCEPINGFLIIEKRRNQSMGPNLLNGPGKVAQALVLDRSFSHHALFRKGGLEVYDAAKIKNVAIGARIGIDYASKEHRDALWRFADADSSSVSYKQFLKPLNKNSLLY